MWERLLEIFLGLISIDGVSGEEAGVRDAITEHLRDLGLEPYEDDFTTHRDGNSGNLVCPVNGGGNLLLCAHMDTVQPTAGMQPVVKRDRIESDGSSVLGADDRAGIAALLAATERLIQSGAEFPGYTLAFTVQEETGSHGSKYLKYPENITRALVFDSSLRPGNFIADGYGAKQFEVTIHGKAAHAGMNPEAGVSAITIAGKSIATLPWGRIEPTATANIGRIEGGKKSNVVADHVRLDGELRALTSQQVETGMHRVRDTFEKIANDAGGRVEFKDWWAFEPYHHEPGTELRELVEKALRKANLTPVPATSGGGSDANQLNARGLPAINIGMGAQKLHSTEEYILHDDLKVVSRIAEIVMRG